MGEHVNGTHRDQTVLFPNTIDQYVEKENPVRFIDAFVDSLDLEKHGFKHSVLADTGRPSYNPSDLLKLYVYGYLNQVRSSRKLEKECHRNVEVMWLMKKLAPDHKTIADFRKNNVDCIKPVFKEFVYLCRSLDLYGAQLVAIDGTKFKAVNSKSNNLNEKTVAQRLKQTEEKISEYLKDLDSNDAKDSAEDETAQNDDLKEKIRQLEEKKQQYEQIQGQMKATNQREVSLVDPDSRLMRVDSQRLEVGYNIQTSVDAKQHLIVDYDVINISTDHHQLTRDALSAKETLGVDELEVLSDKGFYVEKDVSDYEDNGIRVFMPIPAVFSPYKSVGVPEPEFYSDRFVYDAARDIYVCPMGNDMPFWKLGGREGGLKGRLYRTALCFCCSVRSKCTRNKRGRYMFRGEYDGAVDRLRVRLASSEGREKVSLRRMLAEHPFGTMKRAFNQGYLLLKGLRKVKGEVGFTMLAYNMRRAINILGVGTLIALVKA
ncbi:MAG: IS1182 family transposase [Candidatus Bathyarchaeia archaeon]|jgi:transposase